ncbi:MAG: hypothetical protein KF799_15625 [Bdellovibrionales bacterium]|nr:hypothetical protein [Bdellovibrionales bacterium]
MENRLPYTYTDVSKQKLVIGGREIPGPTPGSYPWLKVDYKGLHLVLFWSVQRPFTNSNIHAFNDQGDLVWIVSPVVPNERGENPYSSFTWSPLRNKIGLISFYGSIVVLDETNGHVELLGQEDPL